MRRRAHPGWIVAAAIMLWASRGLATERLSPVELGEAPIFERASPVGDITYTPGRGLHVGNTGLTIGGYANVVFERPEGGPAELSLQDLSAFIIWDPVPRLHVFSELEYQDVFEVNSHGDADNKENALTADRLYADLYFTDLLNLRAGIFRTPVGRWNVIHAAPLVWTTEQPVVTELPFDPSVTGAMVFGSVFPRGGVLTYSIYDQFADPLEGDPEFKPAQHSTGARLQYDADGGWSVGASYLAAKRQPGWQHLGGVDLLWTRDRFELMGELAIEDGAGGGQGGGYLQSVFALTDRLYLVQRFEHYEFLGSAPSVNLITLGVAFRPLPAVVLKAEYLIADRHTPEAEAGFHASIATLF